MSFIEYEKIDLSEETLEKLHAEIAKSEPLKRYGRFKSWLHYANLKRWRDQGHHFHYLSGPTSIHCTCGLVLKSAGDGSFLRDVEEKGSISNIDLDRVQLVRGHRNLPGGSGITIALIYNFVYEQESDQYLWDAFCQECGDSVQGNSNLEVKGFIKEHNRRCKVGPRKGGESGE